MPKKFSKVLNLYSRFIDDKFALWHADEDLAKEFEKFLCTQYAKFNLEITFRFSTSGVEFLDMWLYKNENGIVHTSEFRKETAKDCFLNAGSNHPRHVFKGIIKSQVTRLRRICSEDEQFSNALELLRERCLNSGYCSTIVTGTHCNTFGRIGMIRNGSTKIAETLV